VWFTLRTCPLLRASYFIFDLFSQVSKNSGFIHLWVNESCPTAAFSFYKGGTFPNHEDPRPHTHTHCSPQRNHATSSNYHQSHLRPRLGTSNSTHHTLRCQSTTCGFMCGICSARASRVRPPTPARPTPRRRCHFSKDSDTAHLPFCSRAAVASTARCTNPPTKHYPNPK